MKALKSLALGVVLALTLIGPAKAEIFYGLDTDYMAGNPNNRYRLQCYSIWNWLEDMKWWKVWNKCAQYTTPYPPDPIPFVDGMGPSLPNKTWEVVAIWQSGPNEYNGDAGYQSCTPVSCKKWNAQVMGDEDGDGYQDEWDDLYVPALGTHYASGSPCPELW